MLSRQKSGGYRPLAIPTCLLFLLFSLVFLLFFLVTPKFSSSWVEGERSLSFAKVVALPPQRSVELPIFKKPKSLNCSLGNTCRPEDKKKLQDLLPSKECPSYFNFIHEDLRPWKDTGISLDMVERANRTANFRLVILDGRMYVKTFIKAFQTRDVFTLWGFVQLMEYYPGILPDVDLMFDCVDWPVIPKPTSNSSSDLDPPPPLFRYCSDDSHLDIPFPDWSFWGWPEVNTRPWDGLSKEIRKGSKKIKWEDRDPTAYWKGNPFVADVRKDLMKCNASEGTEWNARLYTQDWIAESERGFKQSNLADQCDHRYKIYVEGSAWSVSLKNIMACDSPTLIVTPTYHDFYSRALMPGKHYWPIRIDKKCESIKFAVDWGNNNTKLAKQIGKEGSSFMREELKMSNVYDYMFHLLNEYSKLLKYKPSIPEGAEEICTQSAFCSRTDGVEKRFMRESMTRSANHFAPCLLETSSDQALKDWKMEETRAIARITRREQLAWSQQALRS